MAPTLLLADDNLMIQRMVALMFRAHGINVVSVSDGDQAIERLTAFRPDIALIGASLQKRNGFEVAEFVKRHPTLRDLPVVLLAGAFDTIDDDRVRACGATAVFVKPLEPGHVINRVKELLGIFKPEDRSADQSPAIGRLVTGDGGAPAPEPRHPHHEPLTLGVTPGPRGGLDEPLGFELEEEWLAESGKEWEGATGAMGATGLPRRSFEATEAGATDLSRRGSEGADLSRRSSEGAEAEASAFGPADAFAVLLAEEQGEDPPEIPSHPVVELSDAMVDRIADRVAERLMQGVLGDSLRRTVNEVSERLVREEIQRIRTAAQSRNASP